MAGRQTEGQTKLIKCRQAFDKYFASPGKLFGLAIYLGRTWERSRWGYCSIFRA